MQVVSNATLCCTKCPSAALYGKVSFPHCFFYILPQEFCEYDDYNWDWSLQYLGKEQITGKFPTLIVKTPRVYHIGEW